jgi:hypothetical protein
MVGLWLREARKHETQGVEEVHLPLDSRTFERLIATTL